MRQIRNDIPTFISATRKYAAATLFQGQRVRFIGYLSELTSEFGVLWLGLFSKPGVSAHYSDHSNLGLMQDCQVAVCVHNAVAPLAFGGIKTFVRCNQRCFQ